jgi:chemotaxis response regulator CheB
MDSDEKLNSPSSKFRVLVVDNHAFVRGFICRLLEAGSQFEIVCEAVMGRSCADARGHGWSC